MTSPSDQAGYEHAATQWKTALLRVREVLPLQNPLQSFLHNNLLMAFERFPFWDGISRAANLYNARATASLEKYTAAMSSGRISALDLCESVQRFANMDKNWIPVNRESTYPVAIQIVSTLMQMNCETPIAGLLKLNAQEFEQGNLRPPFIELTQFEPGRDRRANNQIPDDALEWLCQLMEGILDQGLAHSPNPIRHLDVLDAAVAWLSYSTIRPKTWQNKLCMLLRAYTNGPQPRTFSNYIVSRLLKEGIPDDEWSDITLGLLFQMPGWSGLVNKVECDPGVFPFRVPNATLESLIALMFFMCDVFSIKLRRLAPVDQRLFNRKVNHSLGVQRIRELLLDLQAFTETLTTADIHAAVQIMNLMDDSATAKVWHCAFEMAIYREALSAFALTTDKNIPKQTSEPKNAILFCMDDRNESFRRHLESIAPGIETFGVLGNFNLDMRFVSVAHPRPSQQCPPVVKPRRTILESTTATRRARKRALLIQWWHDQQFFRSRSATGGIVACLVIGFFAITYYPIRVIAKKQATRMRSLFSRFMNPSIPTTPQLERSEHPVYGPCGYDDYEQAEIVFSVLAAIGLNHAHDFHNFVVCLAHKSTSANNPYTQAYGCGACSGNSGSVNAQLFAEMANNPDVRKITRELGVNIPAHTIFVSGVQDTAMDIIEFHEESDAFSKCATSQEFNDIRGKLNECLTLNAVERSQFFSNRPKLSTPQESLQHVQERALNMAEPRPEYGHSRAFLAFFGPRRYTKSLNLDRRSFLISYDDKTDPEFRHIRGLVHGAMPVVANITLDYFFSAIDPLRFGSGSKLPLNISALVGVISGSRGDIRIGLAAQMVEIHEPIRALVGVVQSPEVVSQIALSHKRLNALLLNDWVRLFAIDPNDGNIYGFVQQTWQKIDVRNVPSPSQNITHDSPIKTPVFTGPFAFEAGEFSV
jgi:uncharacterized protein YbcC (UPF0753/DUF2309 family)